MAKFAGEILGAIEIGVGLALEAAPGISVTGAFLVKMGIATEVTALTQTLLAPQMKAQQAQATSVQLGEVARRGMFGEGATAGSLVDALNYGGKYGTDWTVLVIALADHRCDSLVGFYANETYVAFTGDGVVPDPSSDVQFKGQLQVYWRNGSWDQDVPSILLDNCPTYPVGHPLAGQKTWTSADHGRGVCYVVVAYKADKDTAKHPVWSSGRPSFLWVTKGLLCYSAREDSSVGGSAAHRWDDPTTRAWSSNPIDCRYTWVRGVYAGDLIDQPEMLLLGRGLSDVEAPPENVFAPANLCDEAVELKGVLSSLSAPASHGDHAVTLSTVSGLADGTIIQINQEGFDETVTVASIAGDVVTLTAGLAHDHPALTVATWPASTGATEPRYCIGGVFGGDEAYIDTENAFMSACGGWIVEREGSVELVPGAAQPVVWNITDDDLLVGSTVAAQDFRSTTDAAWCNTVAPKYVEPTQKWSDHSAPVRRLLADVIADGKPRVDQPSLSLVTSGTQAQRVAEQRRRLGRLWLTRSTTLGPRFIGAEHGDWLSWSSARYYKHGTSPGTPVLLRIESDSQDEKWQNNLSFRQVSLDFADWDAATDELADGAVAVTTDSPQFGDAPAAGTWTLAADASARKLVFAGAVDDDQAAAIVFEYRLNVAGQADDVGWMAAGQEPVSATSHDVAGIGLDTAYDGAVSYLVAGAQGDRLILSPVTAASSTVAPSPVTLLAVVGGTGSAGLSWRNSTSATFDHSQAYRGTTSTFGSATATGSPVLGGLGQAESLTDTVAAGAYFWWVRTFAADGTPGALAGPVTATVS